MSIGSRFICGIAVWLLCLNAGEAGHGKRVQKVYQVTDLISVSGNTPATSEAKLIEVITSTIAPRSWADKGGAGTIDYHPLTMALVVNQTPDIQDQIADLLAALRRELDREVTVEVQFADVSDEMFQQLGLDEQQETILKPKQLQRLMEEMQRDIHTNVMQAPKITMFNGQATGINITDEQAFVTGVEFVYRNDHLEYRRKSETFALGTQLGLRSVISPDRRSVQVQLDAKLSNLVSDEVPKVPLTITVPAQANGSLASFVQFIDAPRINRVSVERTLTIADGHTALLSGAAKECEERVVSKVPVLCDLPLLGRLFSDSKSSHFKHHLLVLVTPRILVPQEKEQKQVPKAKRAEKVGAPCRFAADHGTLIYPPGSENDETCSETPDEASILRAMSKPTRLPGLYEESRDNIEIVTERIVDKMDAPRFFPLVGPARLHHCHWKCSVYYTKTIRGTYPVSFSWVQPCIEEVSMDFDHLHLVSANEARGK